MRKAKVDKNQPEIVKKFREMGFSITHLHSVGMGCPDILSGNSGYSIIGDSSELEEFLETNKIPYIKGVSIPVEIKEGVGKLTPAQVIWHQNWKGSVLVVRTIEEVDKLGGKC